MPKFGYLRINHTGTNMTEVVELVPYEMPQDREELWRMIVAEYERRYKMPVSIPDLESFVQYVLKDEGRGMLSVYLSKGLVAITIKVTEALHKAIDDFLQRGLATMTEKEKFVTIDKMIGHLDTLQKLIKEYSKMDSEGGSSYIQGRLL